MAGWWALFGGTLPGPCVAFNQLKAADTWWSAALFLGDYKPRAQILFQHCPVTGCYQHQPSPLNSNKLTALAFQACLGPVCSCTFLASVPCSVNPVSACPQSPPSLFRPALCQLVPTPPFHTDSSTAPVPSSHSRSLNRTAGLIHSLVDIAQLSRLEYIMSQCIIRYQSIIAGRTCHQSGEHLQMTTDSDQASLIVYS